MSERGVVVHDTEHELPRTYTWVWVWLEDEQAWKFGLVNVHGAWYGDGSKLLPRPRYWLSFAEWPLPPHPVTGEL